MTVRVLTGDVFDRLAELPDESVHCVVTSPPYFALWDYGVEGAIGLEPTFDEMPNERAAGHRENGMTNARTLQRPHRSSAPPTLFQRSVLRRLPAAAARLRLVRCIGFKTPASAGEFLLDGLPGLLDAAREAEHGCD